MRLEIKQCKRTRTMQPDLGCPYDYTERWTEHWLHFDDYLERLRFHNRIMDLKPKVKEAIETRRNIAIEEAQKVLTKWQARYELEKEIWDHRSKWGKFWNVEPDKPYLEIKGIPVSDVETFIQNVNSNVDLFYGPIQEYVYKGIWNFA
jgi:hypothetical protein